ncbi:MAG: D-2-hydroxyacid dehydrogenase [Alphaproteobacteria bacterium]|nr:D-2-hydroxyacid dehydrogenase [Alphaproteobacteria bacterium]
MSDRSPIRTVLVIHKDMDEVRTVLDKRAGDIAVHYVSDLDQIEPTLERAKPDAVFSISQSTFSGTAQRAAIDYPTVRWFHVGGSGYEYIVPWDHPRVTVTNGLGILAPFLAETALTGMLMLNGNFLRYATQQRDHIWQPIFFNPLQGQTLLVVGFGKIGALVAANAKALGMRVLATRRTAAPDPSVAEVHGDEALGDLIGQADFVSLHIRMSEQNRGLINAEILAKMKQGSFLINTSRGPVIDQTALIDALGSGHLGGAYLDVFEKEPLAADSPLWDMPNVIITPHAADNVHDWASRFAHFFADNLGRWNTGQELLNVVTS